MTNFPTTTPRVAPRVGPRRGAAAGLPAMLVLALAVTLALGSGCQQRAGMPCQQPSDCTPGLICNKPPAAGAQGYGVCEPGLKGLGEICVSSIECSVGLLCSTDFGEPAPDGWHGACQVGSLPDGATADQNRTVDLGAKTD